MRLLVLLIVLVFASVVHGGRDFYKILGIPKKASQKQIKKAYRKAAMEWHPDKHPDDQETANAKFIEINNAYEVLSDEQKRAAYDHGGEEGMAGGGGGGGPGGGGQPHHQQQHGHPGGGAQTWTFHSGGGGARAGGGGPFSDPWKIFKSFFGQGGGPGGEGGLHFGGTDGSPFGAGGGGARMPFGGGAGRGGGRGPRHGGRRSGGGGSYSSSAEVTVLTPATFAKVADAAKRGSRVWLVKFYSPSCPHCQSMVKDINALGKGLRGAARVGVVDCTQHSDVCGARGVRGYPTLKLFGPQGEQDYAGSRSAGGMRNALVGLIPDGVVRVVSGSNPRSLQALRERFCVGRAGGRPKACVLLLSSRSQPSPLFKAVAAHVADLEAKGKSSSSKLTFVHVDVGLKGTKAALAMGALGMKRDKSATKNMLALLHEEGQSAHTEGSPTYSSILSWIKAEARKLRKGK